MRFRSATNRLMGASAAALAVGLCVSPALAQATGQSPTDASTAVTTTDSGNSPVAALPSGAQAATATDEIVVTGSRLAATGFTAPTPVSVVGAADIARQGATNITEVLNQVPAFRGQNTPQTAANFAANLGASTADLRGLGANRTLVLIDGRRVVAATIRSGSTVPANAVDLGMIPTSLIERSEVVTGGASAQYGSDAVAGVVNIILNTKLEGFRGSAQYGITDHGDGKDYAASIGWGAKLGDRGHIIVGLDYDKNKGVGDCYTRDWCAAAKNQVTAPIANRVNGYAAINVLPNTTTATASYNGLVNGANTAGLTAAQAAAANAATAGLVGTEFAQNGQSTFRHNYGIYFFNGGLFQSGGGDGVQPYYQNFALSVPLRKIATYGHAEYELTDSVKAYVDLSYADIRGSNPNTQNRDTNLVIQKDNAFLPASLATALAALPDFAPAVPASPGVAARAAIPASLTIGRIGQDFGPAVGHVQRNTFRAVGGLDGKFANDWKWDAYYQYGRTNYHQQTENDKINDNYTRAIDAVRNASGTIVCRVNADAITTNDDPSCSPLNIFGQNNWSQQAKNYAFGTAVQDTKITQQVAAVSLSGSLFDLWAGPLSFAIGGEYRRDEATGTADAISNALRFYTNPGAGIDGRINVKEGFVELGLPLIKEAAFTYALDLNGAVRLTDYSTTGSETSWKVGATWEPVRQVRLRATKSRDIRAPNIFELYGPQSTSFQSVVDPVSGTNVLPSVVLGGNPNLQPETAKTFTTGLVLQPDFWGLNRLRFSVDYYDIKLNNAIATLGGQLIANLCNAGQTALCAQIVRAGGTPTGTITQIFNTDLNLNRLHTRGLDFELSYSTPLSDVVDGWGGTLSARVLATRVAKLETTDRTGLTIDRSNQVGSPVSATSGVPRWQGNYYLTYANGPFSGTMQIRYVSSGLRDTTLVGPDDPRYTSLLTVATCPAPLSATCTTNVNRVRAYTYLNLNVSYAIVNEGSRRVELFGVVNNVFNTDPPNNIPASFGATNNVLYDVLGRAYRVGVRVAF